MSQDDQNTRGVTQNQAEPVESDDQNNSSDDASGEPSESRVSLKTYRNTVAEAKQAKAKARAAEERLKALEDERLEQTGQKDELIKSLRAKLDGETKRTKDIYNSFARKSLSAQIKAAALEAGCIDADAVMSLADLTSLEVSSETFEADEREIKDVITGLRKSKPYLFSKPGPGVNSKMPGGSRVNQSAPDFKSMTPAEIQKWLRENATP